MTFSSGSHSPIVDLPQSSFEGSIVMGIRKLAVICVVLGAALTVAACGGNGDDEGTAGSDLPQGSEPVDINPDDFTTEIDNPYWPMEVGSEWVYRETDQEGAEQRVEVTITNKTKRIANGVEARVVRDVVTDTNTNEAVEITDDWYAQDSDGNVWYMGEETAEYENGKLVTRAGSFEAGVDGAQPGIIMPADPEVGQSYRQEYYKGKAEDAGAVLSLDAQAEVPAGHYSPAVMTQDTNPLEPKVFELKFYARDVGPVLAVSVSGGTDREELLSYTKGG
jgi:hypothetical protein